MVCPKCLGEGCEDCHRGMVAPTRCPTVEGKPTKLFKAYREFKRLDVLPILGGWYDQSAKFVKAVEFCDFVCAQYDRLREEKIAKLKKMG